jgi:phage I-like protein
MDECERRLMDNTTYLIDTYVATAPGEPYRLLPFGTITKGGKTHTIDRAMAEKFKLPHFKPPIKLGSHDDVTPSGGSIVGLEVREDGLYAVPELTEKGAQALVDGDYRYHSPEVLWEGTGIEDATTGKIIRGPLIVGDALLHVPALGEQAALYSVNPLKEEQMSDENVSVPKPIWDKFTAWLDKLTKEPEVTEVVIPPVTESDEFKAVLVERDQAKTELEQLRAEAARKEQFSALVTQLQDKEKFGSMYVELKTAEEAATIMSGMTEEQRAWCMRNFTALTALINEGKVFGEIGSDGAGAASDPVMALDAAIKARMDEAKVNYPQAMSMLTVEKPELFAAAYPTRKEQ